MKNTIIKAQHTLPIIVVGVFVAAGLLLVPQAVNAATNIFTDYFGSYTANTTISSPWSQNNGVKVRNLGSPRYHVAELNSNSVQNDQKESMWVTVDTTGYENIVLKYKRKTTGIETNQIDEFNSWYKTGTTWNKLESLDENKAWGNKSYNLPSAADNNPNFKIRFSLIGTATNDKAYVDNVRVQGDLIPATIYASKVVCDEESKLPDWGFGGPSITSSTATNYAAANEGCELVDWQFEWAPNGTGNPGDNFIGPAGGAWTTFSGSVQINPTDQIWLREVWNNDYIPFSGDTTPSPWDDNSAEFYCESDVLNYDNYDWIRDLQPATDYYCVGFNVLDAYCGDGEVNQDTEDCDGTDKPDHYVCNEDCTIGDYIPYCGDGNVDVDNLEQCDGNEQECVTDNGYVGTQSCFMGNADPFFSDQQPWCTWNPCATREFCGDETINGTEECDTTEPIACETNDGYAGYQTCNMPEMTQIDPPSLNLATIEEEPEITLCTVNPCRTEEICGDGIKNGAEECDGTEGITGDQTCSDDCTVVEPVKELVVEPVLEPVLSIIKSVDKAITNPGATLTYTVTVSNSGEGDAVNVTLTDTLPAGFTFANEDGSNSGDTEKTWTWDSLATGADVTVTYDVLVDSLAGVDIYENLVSVAADNFSEEKTAKAITEVKIPTVLGDQTPSLTIEKSVEETFINPGGTVHYTVVVTNNGDAPAMNVVLDDLLPDGFVYDGTFDQTTATWDLGDIVPTESVTTKYEAVVVAGTLVGKYVNTATVKADDLDRISDTAFVDVREIQVLGADIDEDAVLPVTGPKAHHYLYLIIAGLILGGSLLTLKLTFSKKQL